VRWPHKNLSIFSSEQSLDVGVEIYYFIRNLFDFILAQTDLDNARNFLALAAEQNLVCLKKKIIRFVFQIKFILA